MSFKTNERRFWFRGSTMAVGGRIESPVCENIEAQCASVLPAIGGFAATSVDRFDYKNIIGFRRATSTVSGQKVKHENAKHGSGTSYDTLVTVAIEDLNILDVITADRVVARMTSTHSDDGREPEALPFGSHFENLRIGGVPVELRPYAKLVSQGSYQNLTETRLDRSGHSDSFPFIRANGESIENEEPRAKATRGGSSSVSDTVLLAPLFKKAVVPEGSETSGAHGIRIPGFGIVYLGEYLITRASRRLTMLRIELGCPVTGSIVCANVDINGHLDP